MPLVLYPPLQSPCVLCDSRAIYRSHFDNLLVFGANVNAVGEWGWTPLHLVHNLAKMFYDKDGFAPTQLLVVRGADMNQPDDAGSMPLHEVLQRSWAIDLELVQMLVDAGAKVNVKDHQGQTPLHTMFHSACDHEDIFCAVLQLLMGCGADVNAQNNDHETPLHLASFHWRVDKWLEIVWILLEHGADLSMENKEEPSVSNYRLREDQGPEDEEEVMIQLSLKPPLPWYSPEVKLKGQERKGGTTGKRKTGGGGELEKGKEADWLDGTGLADLQGIVALSEESCSTAEGALCAKRKKRQAGGCHKWTV
ncbi:ankyrin repeat-containing domain protein [Lactarius deliciosus]|nr:ankyrin repeat-containing domain protein [Lactarius deliciosus]